MRKLDVFDKVVNVAKLLQALPWRQREAAVQLAGCVPQEEDSESVNRAVDSVKAAAVKAAVFGKTKAVDPERVARARKGWLKRRRTMAARKAAKAKAKKPAPKKVVKKKVSKPAKVKPAATSLE